MPFLGIHKWDFLCSAESMANHQQALVALLQEKITDYFLQRRQELWLEVFLAATFQVIYE
jgi:hypothetical protein